MMITSKRLLQAWSLNQSPPWQWRRWSQLSGRLLLIQVLILINLFSLPLAVTASGQDANISSSESPQEQRVTISMSYSSTNFKAGPVNRRGNNSHNIINPSRRHSSVSPVNRNNFKNSNNSRSISLSNHMKGVKPRPRQASFLPDPALNNKTPSNAPETGNTEATTNKPTMHPLRVLQTEISLPTKPSQRAKPRPKNLSHVIFNKPSSPDQDLSNHRMNADDKPTLINDTKNIIGPNAGVNMSSDVRAQLELINQRSTRSRITPNEVLTMSDNKEVNDTDVVPSAIFNEGRSDLSAIFSGESKPELAAVEGRSASEKIEQVKTKKSKVSGGSESKQRSAGAGHFSYINTLEDQIAEEDNQYEVTELVNQYPAEYENQDQGSEPQTSQTPSPPSGAQQQHSGEFQSQIQNPNHNYLNVKPNYRGEKTRPKLHSYYDQNYHLMDSPQPTNQALHYEYKNDFKNHESKNPPHKDFHYYANTNDHGNFHGNHGIESHYVKPGFGPFWHHPLHQPQHLSRPEPSLGQEKYPAPQHQHQHYNNPSPPKHNHPPPQPYKGEHDLQTASTDTIMDRFEVFYKEYKILTWATLFIATSLGFLAILVYMYIRNPPTEVVTARSKFTEYLSDPGVLKFLSKILDSESHKDATSRRRRSRRNETKEL